MTNPSTKQRPAPRVGAVLAAGLSTRFGGPKLLYELAGKPVGAYGVQACLAAKLERVFMVTGPGDGGLWQKLPKPARLERIINPRPQAGMGGSVALAARRAKELDARVLVFLTADAPLIKTQTIDQVTTAALASAAGAAAAFDGRRPLHPVALDARYFDELARLKGDAGARAILKRLGDDLARVPAPPHSGLDLDRPEDLAPLGRLLRQGSH